MQKMSHFGESFFNNLGKLKIFKLLNIDELKYLLSISEVLEYEDSETVIQEGETSPYIYVVMKGEVFIKVKQEDQNGLPVDVYICTIGEGDVIGEAAIFTNVKRTANVVANESLQLIRIKRDVLINFIKKHPSAGVKILMFVIYSLLNKLREVNHELAFERKACIDQNDIDMVINEFTLN